MTQEEAVAQGFEKKYFGAITKKQANTTWVCDALTGMVAKVRFQRETLKNEKSGLYVRNYWTFAKSSYFYTTAKDKEEAITRFNESFSSWDESVGLESITKTKNNYVEKSISGKRS